MAGYSKKFSIPNQSSEKIYAAVSSDIDRFLSKTPLGKVEVSRNEGSKQVTFKAAMASGTLVAKEGELQIDITLSLLASAFKGKIDDGLTHWLNKTFGIKT